MKTISIKKEKAIELICKQGIDIIECYEAGFVEELDTRFNVFAIKKRCEFTSMFVYQIISPLRSKNKFSESELILDSREFFAKDLIEWGLKIK